MSHDVGRADAVGAQESGIGMAQHLPHAELARDGAGMLARRAAEADEHVLARIIAAGHAYGLNRLRHVRIRHTQETFAEFDRVVAAAGLALDCFGKFG